MSDPATHAEFFASLSRCLADGRFLSRFYEHFMASSPEIAAKFDGTDLERQKRALTSSLYALVMAMEGGAAAVAYLATVAERHSRRDLDIPPAMYDLWLECLIATAREHDPHFSARLEAIWRGALRVGIDLMRERY